MDLSREFLEADLDRLGDFFETERLIDRLDKDRLRLLDLLDKTLAGGEREKDLLIFFVPDEDFEAADAFDPVVEEDLESLDFFDRTETDLGECSPVLDEGDRDPRRALKDTGDLFFIAGEPERDFLFSSLEEAHGDGCDSVLSRFGDLDPGERDLV